MNPRHFILPFFISVIALAGCTGSKPAAVEHGPVAYQPTPESTPAKTTPAAAPGIAEVEAAVNRVFKGAAVLDQDYNPNFLTGDFNGDSSQDLAVVLKPVPEKIADLNEQYPAWLLRDPRVPNDPHAPLHVEKNEVLLAVIHGFGANDWRDPQATQTFLLKNIVGSGLRVQDGREFVKNNTGRKSPRPHGDLIGETLKGTEGYLYYSAANYSWYDPKTYTGDTETAGAFHGHGAMKRTQ